ncbi:metal ABC transporter substrate-binding protein [Mobilibacterium timonense]|uniref:metal ABC transporter substrate-binding protein n=1 Tax=Mobilibacterium timonense TaxID=1871012 RepID=UPI000987AB97|nr:metal ABC transporter substrate-binding protein [Mobilibacterium timonense]
MKKKIVTILAAALAMAVVLSGCALTGGDADKKATNEKLSIVCTNFPEYDFARQIAGDKADVTMLLKPGAESHTYEPSPEDIKKIQDCDMFVYVGGDSDEWVEDVLDSVDKSKVTVFRLMDQVKTVEEVTVEGMEPEDEEEPAESGEEEDEPEMDEHVWASPKNAATIVKNMAKTMEKLDGKNKQTYEKNADAYVEKINKLDGEFREVVKNGKRKEIIVADRFPFRYFCEEYGLKYYAAFPGCSTDTQPSAKTVAFLTDKVKEDKIPVVFHIELSNEEMSKLIAEATGAKSRLLNAVHNVSDEDFRNGATYVSLMEHNVEVLKEALN